MVHFAVDHCHDLIHLLGWSVGELMLRSPDGAVLWQVAANRDGHTILAWGPTQPAAWKAACRKVRQATRQTTQRALVTPGTAQA